MVLERIIDGVLQGGAKTHIASRRESLCSSWAAAAASLKKSPIRDLDGVWSRMFRATVLTTTGRPRPDPKAEQVVDQLIELVKRGKGEKVVVFTQRIETSRLLKRLLDRKLK
jgi:ERCC4-related helicase